MSNDNLIEEKGKVKDSESSGLSFFVFLCWYLPPDTEKYQKFIEAIGRRNRDLNTPIPVTRLLVMFLRFGNLKSN